MIQNWTINAFLHQIKMNRFIRSCSNNIKNNNYPNKKTKEKNYQ